MSPLVIKLKKGEILKNAQLMDAATQNYNKTSAISKLNFAIKTGDYKLNKADLKNYNKLENSFLGRGAIGNPYPTPTGSIMNQYLDLQTKLI